MIRSIILVAVLTLIVVAPPAAAETLDKALCAVCAVHGETEKENVAASATHEGETYYFCADKCRDAFAEDPFAYAKPVFPRAAPEWMAETLNGDEIYGSELYGKVVLLDFWATWCKPCRKSMPEVQAIYDRYSDKGFTVAGISIDTGDDRLKKIRKFIDEHDISYPIYSDATKTPAWNEYRVKAVPAMFLIDRNGDVVAQWLGRVDEKEVEAKVAELVGADS